MFRTGTQALGITALVGFLIGVVLGGAVRAVLPEPRTGLLRVRGRVFDTAWMLFLGSGLVTLAFVVPPGIGS